MSAAVSPGQAATADATPTISRAGTTLRRRLDRRARCWTRWEAPAGLAHDHLRGPPEGSHPRPHADLDLDLDL